MVLFLTDRRLSRLLADIAELCLSRVGNLLAITWTSTFNMEWCIYLHLYLHDAPFLELTAFATFLAKFVEPCVSGFNLLFLILTLFHTQQNEINKPWIHFVAVGHQPKMENVSLKETRLEMEKIVLEFYKNATTIFESFSARHKEERKKFFIRRTKRRSKYFA